MTRAGERTRFSIADSSLGYERLDTHLPGGILSSLIIHMPEGYRSEITSHTGEELIYVLEGEVTLVEDGQIVVNKGRLFYWEKGEFNDPRSFVNV